MNLGDGLVFERENGKPKLVLSNNGVKSKNSKKVSSGTRPPKALLKSDKVPEMNLNLQGTQTDSGRRLVPEKATFRREERVGSKAPGKVVNGHSRDKPPRVQARGEVGKTGRHKATPSQGYSEATRETLKESLVCLTQEQLQQILSTISQAAGRCSGDVGANTQPQPGTVEGSGDELKEESPVSQTEKTSPHSEHRKNANALEKRMEDRTSLKGSSQDFFSALGEREREKETLEAKRAQWKKELDEQVALKQRQKVTLEPMTDYNPWDRPNAFAPAKPARLKVVTAPAEEQRVVTSSVMDDDHPRPTRRVNRSPQDLPAAIRTAFVLGEATPVEHAFSAKKREQQTLWLRDLDQQREEDKLRRMQEKRYHSQGEDQERWAMHFESLQKRTPSQLPLAVEKEESELQSARSVTQQLSSSGVPSLAWDSTSPFWGDSQGRVSVDTTGGVAPRASHLRTMTALLDPAQIEDRERKRIKQLEHQRAIAAQVEERRRQREQEEALRRAEQEKEERRLAQERDQLEKRHQLDTLRQRQEEELQTRKTEQLHYSVQKAQEQALREKQKRKFCQLAQKDHDVSRPLSGTEGESNSDPALNSRDIPGVTEDRLDKEKELSIVSPRKDTAVQTDGDMPRSGPTATTAGRVLAGHTPDIPAEYKPLPRQKKPRQEVHTERRPGKENVCRAKPQQGGDPSQEFAWTGRRPGKENVCRAKPQQGGDPSQEFAWTGRRPGWNSQKPCKPFVPASERYPSGWQQNRQERRLHRQMELLTLVEKTASSSSSSRPPKQSTQHQPGHKRYPSQTKVEKSGRSPSAVPQENGLQQYSPQLTYSPAQGSTARPPSSNFFPYVRTDEVYQLDPMAPLSRPATQERSRTGVDSGRPPPNPSLCDPLLHPELLKNKERQAAILKGLSDLRQGLLQKQRELETGFSPSALGQEGSLWSSQNM